MKLLDPFDEFASDEECRINIGRVIGNPRWAALRPRKAIRNLVTPAVRIDINGHSPPQTTITERRSWRLGVRFLIMCI